MQNKNSKTYKNLFFDLDRTLWDYRANSEQTLRELVNRYAPEINSLFNAFLDVFYEINDNLWIEYRDGKLKKKVLSTKRFVDSFNKFDIDVMSFVDEIADYYVAESPKKTQLFPNTIETLKYLKNKGYRLFLLTNGFLEVQVVKIRESKLEPLFERMITSEEAGHQKPDIKIFEYAISKVGAKKIESIMIGDDLENDILGAQRFEMDTVFFNPENIKHESLPTFEIDGLDKLKLFL